MSKLLLVTRLILAFALVVLCSTAVAKQSAISQLPAGMADPDQNPRFQSVAGLNAWDLWNASDQELASEYGSERAEFERLQSVAISQRTALQGERDGRLVLAVLVALALGIACLPWQRWVARGAAKTAQAIAPVAHYVRTSLEPEGAAIIRRDKFKGYSVADELLKWSDLRDKEVITEAEFDEARRKLLNRET